MIHKKNKKVLPIPFLVLLSAFLIFPLQQRATAQRCMPRLAGIYVAGGLVEKNGYTAFAGIEWFIRRRDKWQITFDLFGKNYPYDNGQKIPMQQYCLTGEYSKYLFSDNTRNFFMYANLGVLVGYETINFGKKRLSDGATITNADKFLYGGTLSLEGEYYFNNRVLGFFGAKARVTGGSSITLFHGQFYIGLKVMLLKD